MSPEYSATALNSVFSFVCCLTIAVDATSTKLVEMQIISYKLSFRGLFPPSMNQTVNISGLLFQLGML